MSNVRINPLRTIKAAHQNTFSSPSIVIIMQSMRSLWVRFFLQFIRIVRYKILQNESTKRSFCFDLYPTCQCVHIWGQIFTKNSPEISGVNYNCLPKAQHRSQGMFWSVQYVCLPHVLEFSKKWSMIQIIQCLMDHFQMDKNKLTCLGRHSTCRKRSA